MLRFRVVAVIVELGCKPSIPIGNRGQNAFDGYTPADPGIIVLGGSSDHLVLDVEDAHHKVALADEIVFYPNYGALLTATT